MKPVITSLPPELFEACQTLATVLGIEVGELMLEITWEFIEMIEGDLELLGRLTNHDRSVRLALNSAVSLRNRERQLNGAKPASKLRGGLR